MKSTRGPELETNLSMTVAVRPRDDEQMYPGKKSVGERVNTNWRHLKRGLTPNERSQETVDEKALTADTAAATHPSVLSGVQGVEKGAADEIGGPDHGGRCDEEAAGNTSDGEPDELC